MKRLLLAIVLAAIATVADARGLMLGRGTILPATAGVTMVPGTTDGTALIVNSSASLAPYTGRGLKITISDGTNTATGYLSLSSAETLDAELITNGGFDSDAGSWTAASSASLASVAGGQAGNALQLTNGAADYGYAYQGAATLAGWVLKLQLYHKNGTMYGVVRAATTSSGNDLLAPSAYNDANWALKTHYIAAKGTDTYIRVAAQTNTNGAVTLFDTVTLKQVLTGIKIVSARFGTTQNWASNTGLNTAAASFTITISKQ